MGAQPVNKDADIRMEVPFHDIDILGIVWHGHYNKYFELARTALYRTRRICSKFLDTSIN